jgi:hypothetical protein
MTLLQEAEKLLAAVTRVLYAPGSRSGSRRLSEN